MVLLKEKKTEEKLSPGACFLHFAVQAVRKHLCQNWIDEQCVLCYNSVSVDEETYVDFWVTRTTFVAEENTVDEVGYIQILLWVNCSLEPLVTDYIHNVEANQHFDADASNKSEKK